MSSRKKIADYFGITVEELMGTKKEPRRDGRARQTDAGNCGVAFCCIYNFVLQQLQAEIQRKEEHRMKITEKCKVIVASSLVAALMTGTALPALAASPAGDVPFAVLAQQNSAVTPEQVEALISQIGTVTRSRRAAIVAALDAYNQLDDAGKAAVTNFGVLTEAQQILGIQDALAKCNVNYDAVEDCWAITTPHDDSIDKRKTCGIGPNLYIWDKGNTIVFWEDFTYMGSSELDIDDIILRGGDYKYTYVCDYDNSDYGYDKELGKWFAWATFEMEDSEVEWLRNLLSADTVIMRFEGTDYSKFDYTWTEQDRQAITDIIDLYNLLKAVTPEVREKALCN